MPVACLSLLLLISVLPAAEAVPATGGLLTLQSASLLGGDGSEEITGAAVLGDGSVVVGGSCVSAFRVPGSKAGTSGQGKGFLAYFTSEGALRSVAFVAQPVVKMQAGPRGRIYVRDEGGRMTILDAANGQQVGSFQVGASGTNDFSVDADGSLVALSGIQMLRYDASGKQVWAQTPPAYGTNHPKGCAVDPVSGIAVVVGYGQTHTGHEPYKDPYAHAYDRSGKLVWTLWNPPPKEQAGTEHGGTGLMADGTGRAVCATGDGAFMITVYHDGGNAVANRDPRDPRKPLDKAIFAGAFQDGPGHGMKGAINTAVCFRVEATKGVIEKGSWMCAWLDNRKRANTLRMEQLACDGSGTTYAVGASAGGLPLASPWFSPRQEEYTGGGFLAAFDRGMDLTQCGAWNPGDIGAVAAGSGTVVIGGSASGVKMKGKGKEQTRTPIPPEEQMHLVKPVGQSQVVGDQDAFVAIFRRAGVPKQAPAKPETAARTVKASTKSTAPAQPVASTKEWDDYLFVRIAAACVAGKAPTVSLLGESRRVHGATDAGLMVEQAGEPMAVPRALVDTEQKVALAEQLGRGQAAEDKLLAAYYLQLAGRAADSAYLLARAGRTPDDLALPPAAKNEP
jgi:hypothetical protein